MLHKTPSNEFKPLIEYQYANDKIIVKDKFWPPSEMTSVEFNDHFNSTKLHGIFYKKKDEYLVRKLIQTRKDYNIIDTVLVKNYLNNPKHFFRIEYINPSIGYGLVALENIPKNTVVGIYSGELIINPVGNDEKISQEDHAYDMSVCSNVNLSGKSYHVTIRAKNGDYTRFAHHAFSQSELQNIPIDQTIDKKNVCTANMEFPLAVVDGKPIRYFITTKALKIGEYATISYGMGYWKNRGLPSLFIKEATGFRIANYSVESKQYKITDDLIAAPTVLEKKPEIILGNEKKKSTVNDIRLPTLPVANKKPITSSLGMFAKPTYKKKAKPHYLKPLNSLPPARKRGLK